MVNTTQNVANGAKADRKAELKAKRRVEQAAVVSSLQAILKADEQLLGFARGKIAGGWRGKLNVGPEAFFAPDINLGLTERRLVLQHFHPESGKPSEILPHFFPLDEVAEVTFGDIETFGEERACRLIIRLNNDQNFRIRLKGETNFEGARALAEVFRSLTQARQSESTERMCAHCKHVLDLPAKFCPYCGQRQEEPAVYEEPVAREEPAIQEESAIQEEPVAYAESAIQEADIHEEPVLHEGWMNQHEPVAHETETPPVRTEVMGTEVTGEDSFAVSPALPDAASTARPKPWPYRDLGAAPPEGENQP